MLFLRSYNWSRSQRWLVVVGVVLALILLSTLIYSYERYYRSPTESELYGMWAPHPTYTASVDYEFRPDGVLNLLLENCTPATDIKLKWYVGGRNIYLRSPEAWKNVDRNGRVIGYKQLVVWHILDISPNEIRVRGSPDDEVIVLKRVNCASSSVSNQTMQPTAGRPAASSTHD